MNNQPSTPILTPFLKLFHSRKFMLLLLDTVISLLLYYNTVDPVIIGILQPIFLFAIGGIAYEDGQEKGASVMVQAEKVGDVGTTNNEIKEGV